MSVKKGDIFYTTWGYDQTNIDFVQVIRVSPSGKTAICKLMKQKVVNSERMYDYVVPTVPFGKPFRLRIKGTPEEPILVGSYPYAGYYGDFSSKRRGYFFKWNRKPQYQTATGFGY